MAAPVVLFETAAKDPKKVGDFYTELFGWSIDANNPMNYGLTVTKDGDLGIDGGIFQGEGWFGIRAFAQVDSAQAYLDKAVQLGGKVLMGPDEVPGAGIIVGVFTDPEGNQFGVTQPVSQ